jgi:S1-C subfamily serine protease
MWKPWLAAAFILLAADAGAQTEADLRAAFEAKEIVVLLDMPGSSGGVDIYPQRKPTMKASDYYRDVKQHGVAIRKGSATMVTKVRARDEHIEFQLGGGGATASFMTNMLWRPRPKSQREYALEVKPDRTRAETTELENLRKTREAADLADKQKAAQAEAERRASEGSRFNIRYENKLTAAQMTPDSVRAALKEYVQFSTTPPDPTPKPAPGPTPPPVTAPVKDPDAERKTRPLVVMIKGMLGEDETIGAGFIVGTANDRLYIATANHVVRRGGAEIKPVRVLFDWLPGEWIDAKLLDSADSGLDLAVLAVENLKRLSADRLIFDRLASAPPVVQQGVFFIGYGGSNAWHTRRAPDAVSRVSGETIHFQSAFLQQGDSGGVLVSEDWRILGMLRSDASGEANALAVQRVLDKLREWNYPVALTGPR